MATTHHLSNKINSQHLARKAVVYIRQSTERQVKHNKESQALQYALVDRARELGFTLVEVIDQDLGSSAAVAAAERKGFERLIASVALGEVGIVLSREVSRLLRTDKDWCRLIEVCQIFGTLLGDEEQVYDANLMDDQLILGIKGTMSVVELKVLRMRLVAGAEAKAQRGEKIKLLPPGFMYDGSGKVVKDPDERVQQAINMIFRQFQKLWSMRQTFLWFHAEQVQVPVNKYRNGRMTIVWQLPRRSFIVSVLQNPFYAGAYTWGRQPVEVRYVDGKLIKRKGRKRKPEECRVLIPDHHEGYIDWHTYEKNVKMIHNNCMSQCRRESISPVRKGQGILTGILRCERCGRKLSVMYYGKSGTAARYICKGEYESGGRYCLAFGGSTVDKQFSKELMKVLCPLGMQASLEAIEKLHAKSDDVSQALTKQLQQLQYESQRASEQYNEVDPRNRLVAAELERRWNAKMEELEELRSKIATHDGEGDSLTAEEREEILQMGERFESVWESQDCPIETKKKIIRTVVEEVIVNLDDEKEMLRFIIHWAGGTHTQIEMPKPPSGIGQKTSIEDLDVIRKMSARYGDDEIARVLNKLGRLTATGKRWNEQRVGFVRGKYSIAGHILSPQDPELLTLGGAAKYCGVSPTAIKKLVKEDVLKREQIVPWAPWEIKRSDLDTEGIRKILGVLKETGKLIIKGVDPKTQGSLLFTA